MDPLDDEQDDDRRRSRVSLDAQRYTLTIKMSPITSPTATASGNATSSSGNTPATTSSTTFLLPLLRPASSVTQANAETRPFSLNQLSGGPDARQSSSSATPFIPLEIANADLAMAVDRTFLQTSSAQAARELKKYYEKMGADDSGKGKRARTQYVTTSLDVNGEQRFRVSIRTENDQFQDTSTTPSGRPPSIIPALGGLFNSVISSTARNSLPGGARHSLRRPRSISEPRESNYYASAPTSGIIGGFVDPFTTTRRSLDHRPSSMDEPVQSDPYLSRRLEIDNSPFGPGVIYTEPATPDSPDAALTTAFPNPSLREMQSFESNMTARPDPTPPARSLLSSQVLAKKDSILTPASREATPYSTLVFDILQTYRGVPLPDRLSESSHEPTIKLTSSSSAVPRDDPRFVIWGEVYSSIFDEQTTSHGSHTDLSTSSHSGVSPRRRASRARSGDVPMPFSSGYPEKLIVAATIERWIAQLTSENESFELVHFFITYRIYISGVDLCHLLICRFHWALETPVSKQDEVTRAQVRVRTYKMIRYWLSHWFKVDFQSNPHLCQVLINWVNTLRKDPVMVKLRDALDLVRRIKKLIRECKQEADASKKIENDNRGSLAASNTSTLVSQSDPDLNSGRKSESVFQPSSEISTRGPRSTIDVSTHGVVPAMGALDLPPSLSILPPQRTSLSPGSGARGMLQQPLHMAMLAQTNSALQSPIPSYPHTVPIPNGLPTQHGTLSRALVNTMGKLGRWRRVLNSRSTPVQSQFDCSGVSSFDIEHGLPVDLQSLRHYDDAPQLLGSTSASHISPGEVPTGIGQQGSSRSSQTLSTLEETSESDKTPQPSMMLPKRDPLPSLPVNEDGTNESVRFLTADTLSEADGSHGHQASLSEETASEATGRPASVNSGLAEDSGDTTAGSIRHSSSSGNDVDSISVTAGAPDESTGTPRGEQASSGQRAVSMASTFSESSELGNRAVQDRQSNRHSLALSENSFFNSSEEDYGEEIVPSGSSRRLLRSNDFVEMDDYLSSDEDQMPSDTGPQLHKAARRLPHQRDLQFVSRIDSYSSREDRIPSVHSSVTVEEDDQSSVGHEKNTNDQKLYAWQLDFMNDDKSSEEDEPRDVEAALRRLEGHVDRERQRKKETKINGWLQQVKLRKENPDLFRGEAIEDDAHEGQSSRDGMDDEDVLETPPDDSRDVDGAQIEEHPLPPLPHEMQNQHEIDQVNPDLGRDSLATAVSSQQSQPFPSVNHPSVGRGSEDDRATIEWTESAIGSRAHKISQSLSYKPSFVKISGARALHTPPMHESFVLVNRSLKIAQHLTAIESDIWRHIPIEDLLGIPLSVLDPSPRPDVLDWGEYMKQWTLSKGGNTGLPGRSVNGLVIARDRFWITAMFTASEILLTRPHLRPMLVSKLIRVALKCYTLNNFSSLVAIITGLGLPAVERAIKRMPKSIGSYELKIYEGLKSFSSDEGNYRLIRETLSALIAAHKSQSPMEASMSSTATSADVSRACIPPIGIYLRQLIKLEKLPDYVDPTAPTELVDEDPNGNLGQPRHPEVFANLAPLPSEMTLEPLINVHKQRLISGVVLGFVNCQQLTGKYNFPTDRKLHQKCLKLRAVTMENLEDFNLWE